MRILVLVLLAVAFWLVLDWLYRKGMRALGLDPKTGRGGAGRSESGRPGPTGASGPGTPAEPLVRCEACGSYVPTSRTLPVGRGSDARACSEVCRQRLRSGARR